MNNPQILVLDFGSQYTQLIARNCVNMAFIQRLSPILKH